MSLKTPNTPLDRASFNFRYHPTWTLVILGCAVFYGAISEVIFPPISNSETLSNLEMPRFLQFRLQLAGFK